MKKIITSSMALFLVYLPLWVAIVIINTCIQLHENRFIGVAREDILVFILVLIFSVIIPVLISVWIFRTRNKQTNGIKIVFVVITIVLSLLTVFVSGVWGYTQSYTTNIKNYGIVDYRRESQWEQAKQFFPEAIDEETLENASYEYKFREKLFGEELRFELSCKYIDKTNFEKEYKRVSLLDCLEEENGKYMFKDNYYDGYVEFDEENQCIHYYFGKNTISDY